jgi:hypothetical protein
MHEIPNVASRIAHVVVMTGIGVVLRVPMPLFGIQAIITVHVLVAAGKNDQQHPHP